MCIGRNYAAHIAELNSATPKQPFFFLKPPSSILLPGSGPMLRPKGVDVHYEVELGLVIGKTIRDLREDDEVGAMEAISGTTLCLFMSLLGLLGCATLRVLGYMYMGYYG